MSKKRIFLIDDEADMTQLVGALLSYKGFEVSSCNDAETALGRLMDESYDAVVLDLMMPRMDGFALIGALRQSPRHASTPILALSAKALEDEERKRLLTSNVRYVSKPVSPSKLLELVRASVEQRP